MELNAFWASLLRRRYLVLLALIGTVAVTTLMVSRIGPTYKAEGAVLLFPPSTTVKEGTTAETQGNPYLFLSGLTQARDIVIRTLTAKASRDELAKQEPGASYEATPDFTTSGPVIVVDVTARSSAGVVHSLNLVLDRIPQTLRDLQSGLGLKDSAYITSMQLTADKKPEVVIKGQIRAGIVVGAATLSLSLLLIGLLDGLLAARRSRHQPTGRRARPVFDPDEAANAPVTRLRQQTSAADTGESVTASR